MSWTMKATKGGGEGGFEKATPGNHVAVLVGIIDLGHQWEEGFQGAKARYKPKVYLVWELVTKKKAGSTENHLIAVDLTFSFNENAKLRKWIESRTGKKTPDGAEVDILAELGQPCLLNVVASASGFPKVEGMTGIPDGLPVPTPQTKPAAWKLDPAKLADIPAWAPWLYGRSIAEVVRASREVAGDTRGGAVPVGAGVGGGDDIETGPAPF